MQMVRMQSELLPGAVRLSPPTTGSERELLQLVSYSGHKVYATMESSLRILSSILNYPSLHKLSGISVGLHSFNNNLLRRSCGALIDKAAVILSFRK